VLQVAGRRIKLLIVVSLFHHRNDKKKAHNLLLNITSTPWLTVALQITDKKNPEGSVPQGLKLISYLSDEKFRHPMNN
jgi:hypothetical protein